MILEPLVTIIIPTYNRAIKLVEAIDSAIKQTYLNKQIIVVDDGSTDHTAVILKEKYPQVEYFYKANNGQASARNLGLSKAKGEIIASLDSDDIWSPDFLTICVEKLQTENLDFVFANWDQEIKNGDPWNFLLKDPFLQRYSKKEKNGWVNLNYEELRALYLISCPSPSSSVVIRKSSIISGWNESMKIGDDWYMYLEMILKSKPKAAYTLQRLWRKRVDDINVYDGRKWPEVLECLYISDLEIKIKAFEPLLNKKEIEILQKRYMESLIEMSKHYLFRKKNVLKTFKILSKSFHVNVGFTFKNVPLIYAKAIKRQFKNNQEKVKH